MAMAGNATGLPRLKFCISQRNHALMERKMLGTPKGLSDEKAARMMVALRNRETLRQFSVRAYRLKAYFETHPDYAREAMPNAKAALLRKGAWRDSAPPPPSAEQLKQVTAALNVGKPLRLICAGMIGRKRGATPIVSFIKLNAYRRQNPVFDRFVLSATARNNSKGQLQRWHPQRVRIDAIRAENNDYHKILSMLPTGLPGDVRDDIVQSLMLALIAGSLQRDQVGARVRQFVAGHNCLFPTKYAKFGNSPLVSLDEVLFDNGSMTRGDTVTRGLWD